MQNIKSFISCKISKASEKENAALNVIVYLTRMKALILPLKHLEQAATND